jgi:redox-sensitive bicupin YhaK (pirin superfamily)
VKAGKEVAMIVRRPGADRGRTELDWLASWHSFSFGDYFDRAQMGFRSLRVLNEDRVAPGAGFGMHPHRDMEILTWVLSGALEHRDSLGNGSVIRPGQIQRMTAGTGILHSEYNPSPADPVHLLQIWIVPAQRGLTPAYEERTFAPADFAGRLRLLAAGDGRNGAVAIHQDADLYAVTLPPGESVTHTLRPGRSAWVQVASGAATLNGQRLLAGDGAAAQGEPELQVTAEEPAQLLLFDLA